MRHDGNGKFPSNWNPICKTQVTRWNCSIICQYPLLRPSCCEGKVVTSTLGESILGSPVPSADESEYPPRSRNHEEFDTRVLSHAAKPVSLFSYIGADKLWISLGVGNKMRNISIHDICSTMSSAKSKALPAFYALTGSDNTSFLSGTGKQSAYAKWSTRPELTATLCHLMDKTGTPTSDGIAVIESFVNSLYSVSCTLADVNQARQQIFAQSSCTFECMYLPPTKAAFVEHVKSTTHQAGYVWGQSIIANKCCLARSSLLGSNLKSAGYHPGLPSLEPPNS